MLLNKLNRYKAAGKNTRAGFTLIELLVVVLIIGILSSIALPQYTKAVEKSRLGALLPNLKALRDAQAVQWLETGEFEEDLTKLPVSFPDCTPVAMSGSTVGTGYACGKHSMRVYASGTGNDAYALLEVYTKADMDSAPLGWREKMEGGKKTGETCLPLRGNTMAEGICKSMGGKCGNTYGSHHRYCEVE